MSQPTAHVRTGFGLRYEIKDELKLIYASRLVERLKENDYQLSVGRLEIRLAREFGFCYGVDRAVEYAYETRKKFPERKIFLTGEIIHNPHVNERLSEMGIEFLTGPRAVADPSQVQAQDVVIVPAFGVTIGEFDRLAKLGCTLVDTTCGSVLNVWKNVERYAREGFTAIIHGKYDHEETLATASRATSSGGRYIVLRDMDETEAVARFIEGSGDSPADLEQRFVRALSPAFSFSRDLERIGLANQTTMLSSESLAIESRLRKAMEGRHGTAELSHRFRAFDTICSATQDRQDAVRDMVRERLDLMLVIGGFNSSNTGHLVELAGEHTQAYHIEDASALVSADEIRHRDHKTATVVSSRGWLPERPLRVGVTAGASTPNNRVGEVIEQLIRLRGVDPATLGLREA